VYNNKYNFFEKGKVWSSAMLDNYQDHLIIHFRHPYPYSNREAVLYDRANQERVALSREPLEWQWNLYESAQVFADDMAKRLSPLPAHIGSDGSTYGERAIEAGYTLNFQATSSMNGIVLENVGVAPVGFNWAMERVVDTYDINIPTDYTIARGQIVKTIAESDWQIGHTKDGIQITTQGNGWKQSSDHYPVLTYPLLIDSGMGSAYGDDGNLYIAQTFGVLGKYTNLADQAYQRWAGFSTFDATDLLSYVKENFIFDKALGDEFRIPRIFLCTK
jgi:nitrogen fixation protein FixH